MLSKCSLHFVQTDRQLYVKHVNGRLTLLLSVHVDDLKITGEEHELKRVLELLTENFDELKIERDNFCGGPYMRHRFST